MSQTTPLRLDTLRAPAPTASPITLLVRSTSGLTRTLARTYATTGLFWGTVGAIGALYVFQPYAIWKRIPLIGSYYRDDAYEAVQEAKRKAQLAEVQAEYERLKAEGNKE